MPEISGFADKYNLNITIGLDHLPEGYSYNLILTDKNKRLLGVGHQTGPGQKSITIPSWCLKDTSYMLTVQTLEEGAVVSEENYALSFRENTLCMEYEKAVETRDFHFAIRKKMWEKKRRQAGVECKREVSARERQKYEEKYLEQMDAIYWDGSEYYA